MEGTGRVGIGIDLVSRDLADTGEVEFCGCAAQDGCIIVLGIKRNLALSYTSSDGMTNANDGKILLANRLTSQHLHHSVQNLNLDWDLDYLQSVGMIRLANPEPIVSQSSITG